MSNENPTIAVRDGEELDLTAVDACLKANIPGLEGTPELQQFSSGNSNLTYQLTYDNRKLVLRRPPFGTIAKSAHSMIREYRIMNSLKPVYPAVPETPFYTDDESIMGCEFYVMDKVEGLVIREDFPIAWGLDDAGRGALCESFFDKLIDLHKIDYKAIGLEDFGRPVGYVERQVKGWNKRYENAMTSDVSEFVDVRQWLEDNMPTGETTHSILHGDFRIDNVIFGPDNANDIRAVLDWEISALGDPLMDLGNTLAYWVQADELEEMAGMVMQPSHKPGMMTRKGVIAYYGDKTGEDVSNFLFYLVYGYFRNAVILQQIYYRYFNGQTKDKRFSTFGFAVEILGGKCRKLIAAGQI